MIDWNKIKYFKKHHFSEDPDIYAEPQLIMNLDNYRKQLGNRVYPSPVEGALARFEDTAKGSEHYAISRKSTAIDVFPKGSILKAWTVAVASGLWTGIGVYFDTKYRSKSWCMLHLDNREKRLLWYRLNKKDYFYPLYSEVHMRKMMQLLLVQEEF